MDNGITVVVSSRKTSDEAVEFTNQIQETSGCNTKIIFVTNGGAMGLAQLYGEMMKNKSIESDIIVFCHDDIEFLRSGWGKEVLRLFDEHKDYGIIGVAGSAEYGDKGGWWLYTDNTYGQVLHKHNGESWLTTFSPLLDKDLAEVCVIDGLFMAINRKRVTKNFDPNLKGFHMYDIDFCLANFLDGKTKIGVTTNIRLSHNSIGEVSEQWYKNLAQVNEKYGEYYPIIVRGNFNKKKTINDGKY